VEHLLALGADAGAQQLGSPLVLPQRLTGTGDGLISRRGDPVIAGEFFRDFTIGAGTASTVNGPATRALELSIGGWS
jgi:hypothetical protein